MFALKRSLASSRSGGANSPNSDSNNSSKIRTLRSDYESLARGQSPDNFRSEKIPPAPTGPVAETPATPVAPVTPPPYEAPPLHPIFHQPLPPVLTQSKAAPTPPGADISPILHPEPGPVDPNKLPASSFGSDDFFPEQPRFENVGEILNKEIKTSSRQSSGRLKYFFILLVLLVILGGGFYYWWFILGGQKIIAPKPITPPAPSPAVQTQSSSASDTANNSGPIRQWKIDLGKDNQANKRALNKNVESFIGDSSENEIIEIKILSQDNQAITPQKFASIFDMKFPAGVYESLSNDFSLFLKKENDAAKLGATFKLSKSDNLATTLQNEEATVYSDFKSFYLDNPPTDTAITFVATKYRDADIRYFNFASPPNTSFDYSVIASGDNTFFIFSTSKDSMHSILDYMSTK